MLTKSILHEYVAVIVIPDSFLHEYAVIIVIPDL